MRLTPTALKLLLANEKIHAGSAFSGIFDALMCGLSTIALPTTGDVADPAGVARPTYGSYADIACAFGAEHINSNGFYALDGPLLSFQETGTVLTVTILAFFLYLPGTPNVIYAVENFALPHVLATLDDALKFVPEVALGITDGGTSTVVD